MAKQACFLIQTEDRKGILAEISAFFAGHAFNVLECKQYSDMRENRYYMRVVIDMEKDSMTRRALSEAFDEVAVRMNLKYSLHFSDDRCRMAILVSKTSHCLYDLLAHVREGDLPCEVPLIIGSAIQGIGFVDKQHRPVGIATDPCRARRGLTDIATDKIASCVFKKAADTKHALFFE